MGAQVVQWSRFATFLTLNALVLSAVGAAVTGPALELLEHQRRQIENNVMRLEQVASAAERDRQVAKLDRGHVEEAARRFIQGDNESLLSADLLTRVRQVANERGVSLTSVAVLPQRQWQGRPLVGARIEFVASTEDAARLLSSIERGPSLMLIRRAKLSAQGEGEPNGRSILVVAEIYGVPQWPKI